MCSATPKSSVCLRPDLDALAVRHVIGLLAAALIVIRTLLDNKVKGEADIAAINLPILGTIPTYAMEDER